MGGADQVAAVLAEKLVGPQVERGARVRAAVDVGVVATAVVDEEAAHGAPAHPEVEHRGLARCERVRGAPPRGLALRRLHAEVLSDRSRLGKRRSRARPAPSSRVVG